MGPTTTDGDVPWGCPTSPKARARRLWAAAWRQETRTSIPSAVHWDGAIAIGMALARCRILGLRGMAGISRGAWDLPSVRVRLGPGPGVAGVMNSLSRERPYVVYWNNLPAPYMIERFNALADRGSVDFEAWFSERDDSRRSWIIDESTWRFRHRYVPRVKVAGTVWRVPPLLVGRRPDVLVSLYAEPVYLAGWATAKIRGSRTAFWCVSTSDAWVRRFVWKDRIKRFVFPRVDATLGPGESSRAYAMQFGVPAERAWVLEHAIDVDHFVLGRERALPSRDATRSDFGLVGTVFVYVGRLWEGKGVFHLLEAFERVQREHPEPVSLLLVGDGPDADRIGSECVRRGLRNVVFAGFRTKDELPTFYAASDVFVFPTLGDPYGLVVDEAMASSLPVVSTEAAGEIRERVSDGEDGFIVPPADADRLSERMLALAAAPDLRRRMGRSAAGRMADRTPENWAYAFEQVVERLLRLPRER